MIAFKLGNNTSSAAIVVDERGIPTFPVTIAELYGNEFAAFEVSTGFSVSFKSFGTRNKL